MPKKDNTIFLSHSLSQDTPLYGNGEGIHFTSDKEIEKGDSCNTMNLSLPNHSGTHIDFPYHFNPEGKTINDYPAEYWQFDHVEMVDLSGKVGNCQIIGPELFSGLGNLATDLLMIKTGNSIEGGTDRYTLTPLGLSAELAPFLKMVFPKLRCIGMDLISVLSYSKREEGRKAHNIFLNPDKGEPILLNKDMKLDMDDHFNK